MPLSIHVISLFLFSCSTESTPVYTLTTTANPAGGWLFSKWEQDLNTTVNPMNIAMAQDWEALIRGELQSTRSVLLHLPCLPILLPFNFHTTATYM